jgi:4-hydroxy-3-polyprenylbenzoate decarboxylase
MAYDDLRQWIAALERAGELKRVRAEVDPILEITEITDRVSKSHLTCAERGGAAVGKSAQPGGDGSSQSGHPGGPALLFENIKGHPGAQVLINQFGSPRRMTMALGAESLGEIAERIRGLLDVKTPQGLIDKIKMLPMLAEMGNVFPRTVGSGPCKEVIKKTGLNVLEFPILQCWPKDAGRFITLPCVITHDPRTGKRNVGMYRMQVYDGQTLGMHWQRQKVGAEHYREAMRRAAAASTGEGASTPGHETRASLGTPGRATQASAAVDVMARTGGGAIAPDGGRPAGKLEVAVAIGTEPALTFSAIVPAPPEVEEFLIAGFLRQKPIELVKCETVELEVPATAEIVLEGYVNLDELRTEGPFGDHTGFYSLEDEYPVMHLTCITHRRNPIYATTIVGKPPMEDAWMGKAVERIFLPLMRLTLPEIVDVNLPPETIFHNLMIVSIRKSYPGHARKVMSGIWAMGQAMFTKCIVVVDEDVDVHDVRDVVLKVFNHIDPERDIQFTLGPVDSLDHSSRLPNFGSKMGIDATRKWPTEGFTRPWPDEIIMSAEVKAKVDRMWKELGIG